MSTGERSGGASGMPRYEKIEPLSRSARAGRRPHGRSQGSQRTLLIIGAAALALLATGAALFSVLPRSAPKIAPPQARLEHLDNEADAPVGATDPTGPAASADDPAGLAPYQRAQLERARAAADQVLRELVTEQFALEERGVERWAPEKHAEARAAALRGDEAFGFRRYDEAVQAYSEALQIVEALSAQSEHVLRDALAAGQRAIDAGNAATATEQFQLALVIEPQNKTALRGVERAAKLDRVLAAVEQARSHERRNELEQARDRYNEALQLDPEHRPAQESLARVQAQLSALGFEQVLSSGFTALARAEYRAARDAFQRALSLRPESADARDGLAQAELQLKLSQIASHREQAAAAVSAERWKEAVEHYRSALELDPNLSFAKQGLERAGPRAQVDEDLEQHIEHPERLSDDGVFRAAQQLLERARAVPDAGPRLQRQTQRFAELLQIARTPVSVRLVSDNQTDIVLFKVGELGSFESRVLELSPGTYTALGRRDGYRDVRREFTVVAGQAPAPIVIQCEEKI